MVQSIGVWGANGYAGEEVLKILSAKTDLKIVEIGRERDLEEVAGQIAYAILALPTEESLKLVPDLLKSNVKVIDLSGAFRLRDAALFEKYYGLPHTCPELLAQAVYGLTEKNSEQIQNAKLIANPGCYATAVELALLPLCERGLIKSDTHIFINAVSGYTGAGKHARIPDKIRPYKLDRAHQHVPEIEQVLGLSGQIHFYPHIAPWPRGIEATIRFNLWHYPDIVDLYFEHYYNFFGQNINYVRIADEAKREDVIGTNFCMIAPEISRYGEVKITVAIDNLGKGAAGQAVQNLIALNPSFGYEVYKNEVF